jgi:hypothetical protein
MLSIKEGRSPKNWWVYSGKSENNMDDDWEYLHFRKLPCISTNKK